MVLIQQEETKEENANPSATANAKSSITTNADGSKTASDADLGSDDDAASNHGGVARKGQPPQHSSQEQEQGIHPKSDASEYASKNGELVQEALSRYELALQVAPDMPSSVEIRSICHANCALCFLKLGKYDSTIKECTKALELNPVYVKAMIRRGEAQEKPEHFEEAIAAKLKEMGNSVLGRFGMSIDNFKAPTLFHSNTKYG